MRSAVIINYRQIKTVEVEHLAQS